MKKLLLLLSCLSTFYTLKAQTIVDQGTPVLFVNSDRTQILRVKADSGAPKVILQSVAVGTLNEIRASHLAILASTRDGKSLLIAGVFHFKNINNDSPDSLQGFMRIDSPFTFAGRISLDRKTLGGQKILYSIPFNFEDPGFIDVRKPLPLGALSPNEQDWYGNWAKNGAAKNSFEFYHGKFNATGTVDVGTLPNDDERLPDHEYHMTNMCADDQGRMISVVMDRLTEEDDLLRARLWRWTPGQTPQLSDMNVLRTLRPNWHMDSSFVCLLRIVPGQSNPTAEIGVMPNDEGNIEFYDFRYDGANIAIGSPNGRSIPRSIIPDSLFFFTGITENPQGPGDDRETHASNQRHVNGGDMMFSQTGDSVVFITANALTPNNAADWYASPHRSGIWIYNIAEAWPQAKLVYNNSTKMERQPIFMGYIPKIEVPPPPGTITVDKTALDFGKVKVTNDSKTLGVKITNPAKNESSITSFEITGPQELYFFNEGTTPPMTTPFTLTEGQSVTLNVKFDPSAEGNATAKLTIRFADGDSLREVSLAGVGEKDSTGAVDPEDLAGFRVSAHPNPFSSATSIEIRYDDREPLAIMLVDVLGREYSIGNDQIVSLGAGQQTIAKVMLDRNESRLATGSYTLHVRNGERIITKQLVLVSE